MPNPTAIRDSDYLEGMLGLTYPFKSQHSEAFDRLFADVVFCYHHSPEDPEQAPELDAISLSGTYGSEVVSVTVTAGGVTYVAAAATPGVEHTVERSTLWVTHSWRRSTPAAPFWLSVTFGRTEYEAQLGQSYSGLNLALHDRCYRSQPRKLRTLSVEGVDLDIEKPVRFVAGSAVLLSHETNEAGDSSSVTIGVDSTSAVGGTANCSDNVGVVRTINGVAPDDYGSFFFLADSCHWVTDLGASSNVTPAQLSVFNNCVPCIDCDSVFETYQHLVDISYVAGSNRQRLCDLVTVFNDYATLISLVDEDLKKFKLTMTYEQTDYEAYSLSFRLHVGPKAIKFFSLTVSYTSADIESAFQPYSLREKVFGYANRQKLKQTTTPTNPEVGADFDGTYLEYDATALVAQSALREFSHAGWYWNMYLRDTNNLFGAEVDVDITYRAQITFTDNTTYDSGNVTETVTIISQNGGSA